MLALAADTRRVVSVSMTDGILISGQQRLSNFPAAFCQFTQKGHDWTTGAAQGPSTTRW
jgi:hypothetical protein